MRGRLGLPTPCFLQGRCFPSHAHLAPKVRAGRPGEPVLFRKGHRGSRVRRRGSRWEGAEPGRLASWPRQLLALARNAVVWILAHLWDLSSPAFLLLHIEGLKENLNLIQKVGQTNNLPQINSEQGKKTGD